MDLIKDKLVNTYTNLLKISVWIFTGGLLYCYLTNPNLLSFVWYGGIFAAIFLFIMFLIFGSLYNLYILVCMGEQ